MVATLLAASAAIGQDPCSTVSSLACGNSAITTLSGTTSWTSQSLCGFARTGQARIYSFVPSATGTYSMTISANSLSDYAAFSWATSCAQGATWTCEFDVEPGLTGTGTMSGTWTVGTTYYLLWRGETTGITGSVSWSIGCLAPCSPGSANGYALCTNGTVPPGDGLTAPSCGADMELVSTFVFPGSNYPSTSTTPTLVSTLTVPQLPVGAVVTGGTINFYGITATSPSWLAEIIVDLHGLVEATGVQLDATEGPGTVASVSGELTPPFEGWNAGGTVELWAYELYDDPEVSPDGTIGNVVLQLEFTLPTPLWFDAPTGGNLVAGGTVFDPVSTGIVSTASAGTTTFYAACNLSGQCSEPRASATITVNTCSGIAVSPKVFLEGSYNPATGLMGDALRSGGLLPTTEPYTGLGYTHVSGGGETVAPAVLAISGNNAVVDWVIVELRDNAVPTTIVASRSALLQRDGDIVAVDGSSPVTFTASAGTYRVAVRHRNHLGAMTLNGVALSTSPATVDLTSAATGTYGTNARKSITGTFPALALWAGDVTFNGQVKYTGGGNDRDPILTTVGSTTPNNTVTMYSTRDVNLNGQVKYTGGANDRDPILINVGSTTPNATRTQQLP